MFKIAALMLATTSSVYAHDAISGWEYPLNCCSGIDCRVVLSTAVRETKSGYVIARTGELITYRDPRLKNSPDGAYHWCSVQGKENTPTVCLFIPQPGS